MFAMTTSALFSRCRDTTEQEFRSVCYQGIGGDAAIKSSKYVIGDAAQAATTRQLCMLGPDPEASTNCVIGAVTTIVRDLEGEATRAQGLCGALLDPQLVTVCETTRAQASQGVPPQEGAHQHTSEVNTL